MPPVGTELTMDQLLSALQWKVEHLDIEEEIRTTKIVSGPGYQWKVRPILHSCSSLASSNVLER